MFIGCDFVLPLALRRMMETHLELHTFAISHPVCHADSGGAMAIAWYGGTAAEEVLNPGPLT